MYSAQEHVSSPCWEWSTDKRLNFKSLKCFKEFTEILLKQFWLPFPNIILPHMDDDSICSLVLHHNVPKFLVHIRDGCLSKAAVSCSPATDVSNNRVTHYKSPGLGCALSWMPLSARHWAPVSSNVSCWLIRSKFCHVLGFLIHIHQCFKSVLKMYRGL